MILDTVENAERYYAIHPLVRAAFQFLRTRNPVSLPSGIHEIRGKDLYAIVAREETAQAAPPRLEAHRRYMDIQVAVRGEFPVGWRPRKECRAVDKRYSPTKDIAFYRDPATCAVTVGEGMFVILFPEDAHAPAVSRVPLVKVVFKLAIGSRPGTRGTPPGRT